jgi:hypothetical protein
VAATAISTAEAKRLQLAGYRSGYSRPARHSCFRRNLGARQCVVAIPRVKKAALGIRGEWLKSTSCCS